MNARVLAHGRAFDSDPEIGYTDPHKPTSQLTWGPMFSPTDSEIYLIIIRYRRYVTAKNINMLHSYLFKIEKFEIILETAY
jgi:hypothetical protein